MGHSRIRYPDDSDDYTVRFGFVIVDPAIRGLGNGKRMLQLAWFSLCNPKAHTISYAPGIFKYALKNAFENALVHKEILQYNIFARISQYSD